MTANSSKSRLQVASDRLAAMASTITRRPSPGMPSFDDLPKVEGQPQGCLWGFFDKGQKKDEVGSINLLTPAVVKEASREISIGEHVQLDWSLDNIQFGGFGRQEFKQDLKDLLPPLGFRAFDDELHFNTQISSQWDSLKHFAHQKTGMYYNGLSHEKATTSTTNGIHNLCERGGIVGRGILVDWLRWHENTHGNPPLPASRYEIPISEIEETLKYQGTTTRMGDIMLVRSGYVRWHNFANPDERRRGTQEKSDTIGLQGNEATVRWLYDQHFAAVGGDSMTFEAWPPDMESGWCLHEWLLVQWGTPIGEMWDLEALSKKCEQNSRWSFFLTSAPLHVKGGVASPPGAIAIF